MRSTTALLLPVLAACAACGPGPRPTVAGITPMRGLSVSVVAEGLDGPTDVHMGTLGRLTIVEAGAGRVLVRAPSGLEPFITGLSRGEEQGAPVAAAWVDDELLAVVLRQHLGGDRLAWFRGPATADEGELSDPAWGADGEPLRLVDVCALNGALYALGRTGAGAAWVLRAAPGARELEPFASVERDELHGLVPTAILPYGSVAIRALFSGAEQAEDGLLFSWNPSDGARSGRESRGRRARPWRLPTLAAGAGAIAHPPEENAYAVGPSSRGALLVAVLSQRGRAVESGSMAEGVHHAVSATTGPNGVVYVLESGPGVGRLLLFDLE